MELLSQTDHPSSFSFYILRCMPAPSNVSLLRALWSLLEGIWGVLKGSWGGVLADAYVFVYMHINIIRAAVPMTKITIRIM